MARLRAGEADLEPGEDAALGRTRSLAASLSYGFAHAFTDAERGQLAVLHLFRDTIDADALRLMGDPDTSGDDAVPAASRAQPRHRYRAAGPGRRHRPADSPRRRLLPIHPALPWYFTTLYTAAYGPSASAPARQAARAYTHALAWLGDYYHRRNSNGAGNPVPALRAEEANLLQALDLPATPSAGTMPRLPAGPACLV